MQRICVLGLGYIGLPTATMFATHGYQVIGVDTNKRIIETLNNGDIHIEEPGLKAVVQEVIKNGNLKVEIQIVPADVFIIAVPTPFIDNEFGECEGKTYKKADMSYVVSAAEMIVPHLRKSNMVVLESTSPPKTTNTLVRGILEESGLKAGTDFYLVYSPERVLPGQILRELVGNARVIGGIDGESAKLAKELYTSFVKGDIVLTDSTTAEMVKLMENTYRDVNIALANEFSRLAERIGFDVNEAIAIANYHPRVEILKPGPGVGGHCISVDPWFLVEAAPQETNLIYQARKVNDSQPAFIVELVRKVANRDIVGTKIAALGLAYKPNVDDMRVSPAVEVVKQLKRAGAIVQAYDPYAPGKCIGGLQVTETFEDAVYDVDMILLLVAHDEFLSLQPEYVAKLTVSRQVIDTVNGWKSSNWQQSDFMIYCLGTRKK